MTDEAAGQLVKAKMSEGYQAFQAGLGNGANGDGKAKTTVSLVANGPGGISATYVGVSGEGHAEINALAQLCQDQGIVNGNVLVDDWALGLECEAKPCCCRCSAILGLLDVVGSDKTLKCPQTMTAGGTWGFGGGSDNLKQVLRSLGLDVTQGVIRDLCAKWTP